MSRGPNGEVYLSRAVIEIHTLLEGCGSEYLGDWGVEIDWGKETDNRNRFSRGFEPLSIKLVKCLEDKRKDDDNHNAAQSEG